MTESMNGPNSNFALQSSQNSSYVIQIDKTIRQQTQTEFQSHI